MTKPKTCGATNRQGQPCQLPAGWGTNHVGEGRCKLHGGAAPQVENAIEQRLQQAGELSSQALLMMLQRKVQQLDKDKQVSAKDLDRLARTVLDRIGYGPTETRELTGKDGADLKVLSEVVEVTENDDDP